MKDERVSRIVREQCQYQQENGSGDPVKKPTGWMSNSAEILVRLGLRCRKRAGKCSRREGGQHAMASGRLAREAAVYSFQVCRAILKGCVSQLKKDGKTTEHLYGIQEC